MFLKIKKVSLLPRFEAAPAPSSKWIATELIAQHLRGMPTKLKYIWHRLTRDLLSVGSLLETFEQHGGWGGGG